MDLKEAFQDLLESSRALEEARLCHRNVLQAETDYARAQRVLLDVIRDRERMAFDAGLELRQGRVTHPAA